jgi:hypothetical protein
MSGANCLQILDLGLFPCRHVHALAGWGMTSRQIWWLYGCSCRATWLMVLAWVIGLDWLFVGPQLDPCQEAGGHAVLVVRAGFAGCKAQCTQESYHVLAGRPNACSCLCYLAVLRCPSMHQHPHRSITWHTRIYYDASGVVAACALLVFRT